VFENKAILNNKKANLLKIAITVCQTASQDTITNGKFPTIL